MSMIVSRMRLVGFTCYVAGLVITMGCSAGGERLSGDGGAPPPSEDSGTPDGAMPDAALPDAALPDADPCADVDCSTMTDMCNTGVCNPMTGACEASPMMDGTLCDDGDACTSGDMCSGGACGGAAADCSMMTDMCNTGTCNAMTGACEPVPVADDTACDDSDMCTSMDVCTAGACAGGAIDCSMMTDMCNTGTCNVMSGACEPIPVVDGTMCDDMDASTTGDMCTAGICAGSGMSGHAVLIGHDYFAREANADRVVGNAVLLANTRGTIGIVVYTEHADNSAAGEVANTRAAIDATLMAAGRSASYTTLSSARALDLSSADVLLIPEQEMGSASLLSAVGASWNTALNTFIAGGGVVIACDFNGSGGGTWQTVSGTGLFTVLRVTNITSSGTVTITVPASPLAAGVSAYAPPNGSLSFPGATGGTTVVSSAAGDPVVMHLRR